MNKQQLAAKIWASANKMRSKIEANEYKDYILGLIFYKFLSDNEVSLLKKVGWDDDGLKELVADPTDPDSRDIMEYCCNNIGYFIEYKYLFSTWLRPQSDFRVDDLNAALGDFEERISPNYKDVYKGIFKTLQSGLSKLGESTATQTSALNSLVRLIKDIPTDGREDYDVLGYIYEFLISNFAANAGKKAGEFYTPHEVAVLMSEIVANHHKDKGEIEIYDPTSGSGSLLITIGKSVGRHISDHNRVKYYAQELKENTYNLTRMNLVMRGISPSNIKTRCADSLAQDWPMQQSGSFAGEPLYVDAVVSNPPYSQQWDPSDMDTDPRFREYGVAPRSKADYAFLLHELHHLKPDGIMTIVLPHGVLFRDEVEPEYILKKNKQGEEEKVKNPKESTGEGRIRKQLIEKNNIDAIIGLPSNIFFGTGIPTLIMVLKQHRTADDVLIIDASKGYEKDGKNNRLRACDIKRISDTVRDRVSVPGFSRVVSRDEIRLHNYNLNIPRYVESTQRETCDVFASVFGGLPSSEIDALGKYWEAFPSLRGELFEEKDGYGTLRSREVTPLIESNADVQNFRNRFGSAFDGFGESLRGSLIERFSEVREQKALDAISEDVFARLKQLPLIDKYDVYQVLSDAWKQISSDIEILQTEGLAAARVVEAVYKMIKKGDEDVEVPAGRGGRIIPFCLVQEERFQKELSEISELEKRGEELNSSLEESLTAFSEDEDLQRYLEEDSEPPRFDKKAVKAGAKAKTTDSDLRARLQKVLDSWDGLTSLKGRLKERKARLEDLTAEAIASLSDEEIKELLYKKWVLPLCEEIGVSLSVVISRLEKEVKALEEKYDSPLCELDAELSASQKGLSRMISDLQGNESDMKGLAGLVQLFNL